VRANKALYDYCVAFGVPLISGKDSMKNDYQIGETKISIPPTVLFSVIGRIDDVRTATTMDAKHPGDLVYLLGLTRDELGGSEYYALQGHLGKNVPQVDAPYAMKLFRAINRAQQAGVLASCHDLSDGGLGVALAETASAGGFGIHADLRAVKVAEPLREDAILFSESQSRFLATVRPGQRERFEGLFSGQDVSFLGEVTADDELRLIGLSGEVLVRSSIHDLKEAWQTPLKEL
jgi:phosphoribosylformylglycinamidine synthase